MIERVRAGDFMLALGIHAILAAPHTAVGDSRVVNPVLPGADPHAVAVSNTVWIYPTWSDGRRDQRFFAFSSTNFTSWERHGPVLDFADINWITDDGQERHFAWAPSVLEKDGQWYFYYSVGPQNPT